MQPKPFSTAILALVLITFLGGCAAKQPGHVDYDPIEPVNRKIFWFNDKADVYVLEPAARGWDFIMPNRVQTSISNFFKNLAFPIVFFNSAFQAKPHAAATELARFMANTTFGLLGFFVGQVIKASGGKANPATVNDLVKKALEG